MREPAMVDKAEGASGKASDNVKVRGLSREGEREGCVGRLAIQPGAAEVRAKEEVGYGFQAMRILMILRRPDANASHRNRQILLRWHMEVPSPECRRVLLFGSPFYHFNLYIL